MKKRIILGVILLLISFIQVFISQITLFQLCLFFIIFAIGAVLIFDSITLYFYKKSLLRDLRRNKRIFFRFILVSTIGVILLDFIALGLGKLWIYPYWDFWTYLVLFIPVFTGYWFLICESYLGTKAVIDYLRKGKKIVTKSFKHEKVIFNLLGVVGICLILVTIFLIIQDYSLQGNILFSFENINSKTSNYVCPYGFIMLLFVSFWMVLEFVQHKLKKNSLIKDLIHGHFTPLISILISSFLLSIVLEALNLTHYLWEYVNWPFEGITFLGLPVMMFLAWPIHYILFLSLWRTLTNKQSEDVWKGDLIK